MPRNKHEGNRKYKHQRNPVTGSYSKDGRLASEPVLPAESEREGKRPAESANSDGIVGPTALVISNTGAKHTQLKHNTKQLHKYGYKVFVTQTTQMDGGTTLQLTLVA